MEAVRKPIFPGKQQKTWHQEPHAEEELVHQDVLHLWET